MNIEQKKLDAWNGFAEMARNTAINARLAYARGDRTQGDQSLGALIQAAAAASVSMEAAGAQRPSSRPASKGVPLGLLSTEKSRRYAKLMRAAYEAAREMDHERGYGDDGAADFIEDLALDAEQEACGAVGLLRE